MASGPYGTEAVVRTVIKLSASSWMFLVKTNYLDLFFPNQLSNRNEPFGWKATRLQITIRCRRPRLNPRKNSHTMFELGRPLQAAVVQSKGREKTQTLLRSQRNEPYTAHWMLDSQSELHSVILNIDWCMILNSTLVEEQLQSAVIWHWQVCLVLMFLVKLMNHSVR